MTREKEKERYVCVCVWGEGWAGRTEETIKKKDQAGAEPSTNNARGMRRHVGGIKGL
jgi:hypothetical protein